MPKLLSLLITILLVNTYGFGQHALNNDDTINTTKDIEGKRNELLVPNAFTPNNDGQNDLFKITNITNKEKLIEFKVFNRWGTIMFRTSDPELGWDGRYKGQLQPFGVYGYVIIIAYPEGLMETYKGTVTLVR